MTEGAPSLPKRNTLPDPESWERRKNIPFPRSFFQLQYDFAKIVSEKSGKDILTAIHENAPYMNRELYNFKKDGSEELLERDPETDIVDFVYNRYLEKEESEPVPYNDGSRFGCFMYNYDKKFAEEVYIHFVNAEFDTNGPLSSEKIAERERELHDVFKDIREQNPAAKTIHGHSWLYSFDAYRRLFPDSYAGSLIPDEGHRQWSMGTTLWGQFLDSEGGLKSDLANILLERARNFEEGDKNNILTPPLTPAFYAEAPIEDFYKKFGVE